MLGSRPAFIEIQEREKERERDWRSLGADVPAGDSLLSFEEERPGKEGRRLILVRIYIHTSAILNRKGILEGSLGLIASGIAVRTADKND